MASFPELRRSGSRPAPAGSMRVPSLAWPVLLAVATVASLGASLAVTQLASTGGEAKAPPTPEFLTSALGAPQAAAPLVRNPAPDLRVRIGDRGYSFAEGGGRGYTLAADASGAGRWVRYANGAGRRTSFGAEAVTVGRDATEESLVVRRHEGRKLWRWRIGSRLRPRLGNDGAVYFLDPRTHRVTDLEIKPVAILDEHGERVTPRGLRWRVIANARGGGRLELRLDDRRLPAPYVIDPISIRSAVAGTGFTSNTSNNVSQNTLVITKPTGVVQNDLMIAHLTVLSPTATMVIVAPTGWNLIRTTDNGANIRVASYYKVAGATEGANYTFSWQDPSGTNVNKVSAGGIMDFYGVKNSAPVDNSFANTGNSKNANVTGISTAGTNRMLEYVEGNDAGKAENTPPSVSAVAMTERNDNTTGGTATATDADLSQAAQLTNVNTTGQVLANPGGNWSAQMIALTPETTAPSTATTFPVAGSSYNAAGWNAGCGTVGFCGTASDGTDSGVSQVQISIKRSSDNTYWNGSTWSGTTESLQTATGTTSWNYAFAASNLTDGVTYTVHTVATDNAGNTETSSTWTFKYDTTNPSAVFGAFPAASGTYNATSFNAGCATNGFCGTDSDSFSGVNKVEISIQQGSTSKYWNGTSFAAASETFFNSTLSGSNWSYTFPASNFPADGSYTVHVRATDNAGNQETGPSRTFTYDTTAPDTSITANPSNPTTATSASFSFTSTEVGSTFECKLDAGSFASCTSPQSYTG